MSYSTTATTTYPLTKYSRLYPKFQRANVQSKSEWEHFTNSSIFMVLDVKKGGHIESVRLRICLPANTDNGAGQGEVNFEDLDLLALSRRSIPNQKTPGPPIKAVHRDSVVGIRYLNTNDLTNEPIYRRFQITFMTSASAMDFINIIGTVCPCKANPVTDTRPLQQFPASTEYSQPGHMVYSQANVSSSLSAPITAQPLVLSSSPEVAAQYNQLTTSLSQQKVASSQTNVPSFLSAPMVKPFSSPNISVQHDRYLPPSSQQESNDLQMFPSRPFTQQPTSDVNVVDNIPGPSVGCSRPMAPANPRIQGLQQESSLPSSSPPSSSAIGLNNNSDMSSMPPPADGVSSSSNLTDAILSSLKESTSLYDLSRDELERLVTQIVQEDGFPKLLEELDSMWRVKSVLGIRPEY